MTRKGRFSAALSILRIDLAAIANPAAVLDALRVVMGPVNEAAKLIPLKHAPNLDAITHAERHALGEVEIVRNQQRPVVADINDETLVARAFVVIM